MLILAKCGPAHNLRSESVGFLFPRFLSMFFTVYYYNLSSKHFSSNLANSVWSPPCIHIYWEHYAYLGPTMKTIDSWFQSRFCTKIIQHYSSYLSRLYIHQERKHSALLSQRECVSEKDTQALQNCPSFLWPSRQALFKHSVHSDKTDRLKMY